MGRRRDLNPHTLRRQIVSGASTNSATPAQHQYVNITMGNKLFTGEKAVYSSPGGETS